MHIVAFDQRFSVLHHLPDFLEGWCQLADFLAENGVMRGALYGWGPTSSHPSSRASRRYGIWGRASEYMGLSSLVLSKAIASDPSKLLSIEAFYSSCGCRDLVFRARERNYNLDEIAAALEYFGWNFLGYGLLSQKHEDSRAI
jgi:hypothetical protein